MASARQDAASGGGGVGRLARQVVERRFVAFSGGFPSLYRRAFHEIVCRVRNADRRVRAGRRLVRPICTSAIWARSAAPTATLDLTAPGRRSGSRDGRLVQRRQWHQRQRRDRRLVRQFGLVDPRLFRHGKRSQRRRRSGNAGRQLQRGPGRQLPRRNRGGIDHRAGRQRPPRIPRQRFDDGRSQQFCWLPARAGNCWTPRPSPTKGGSSAAGSTPRAKRSGFLLTPLPVAEPSSLVLLGAGESAWRR